MPEYPTQKLKTISYDSPSGKININKWIPPFEEVENGFGFVGVLAEDTGTGKLQCHLCGSWYELLTTHIWAKHEILSKDYSEMFGLFRNTALKSMRIRKIQSKVMLGMRKTHAKYRKKFKKGNVESGNRGGKPKAAEGQNRFGVCDLQVQDKIVKLRNKLNRTPALTELIDEYGGAFSTLIHNRYGGYLALLREYNWTPVHSSWNPKYSQEYFIKVGVDAVLSGEKLIGSRIFSQNEERHVYTYFSSQKTWRDAVEKRLKKINK